MFRGQLYNNVIIGTSKWWSLLTSGLYSDRGGCSLRFYYSQILI